MRQWFHLKGGYLSCSIWKTNDKPTKWGIKVWVLSDAKTGYVYRLLVYTGKEEGTVETGLTNKVVLGLLSGMEDQGLHVYTDDFYTSPNLLCHLFELGIYGCGTVRVNRKGFPKDFLFIPKADEKNIDHARNHLMVLLKSYYCFHVVWQASCLCHVNYSWTIHRSRTWPHAERRTPSGVKMIVTCPKAVLDYNQYMRGVDKGIRWLPFTMVAEELKSGGKGYFSMAWSVLS